MTTILQRTSRRIGTALAVAVLALATTAHAQTVDEIRNLATLPTDPIQDVVLGVPAFSSATTGYVTKQLADLDSVPFGPDVVEIDLTTKEAAMGSTWHDKPVTVIWRKPVDEAANRRRPLTIYNYSNIALFSDNSILVFGIPSRGLMYQFAQVLRYQYKQKYRKDVNIVLDTFDPSFRDDAAVKNYARLNAFFAAALDGPWAAAKGKTFTLVFGYKKAVDKMWRGTKEGTFASNGWVGTIYAPKGKPTKLTTDFVVTLDSDKQSSYHVEVLAKNIRGLLDRPPGDIRVMHLVLAGSAGYIGNAGNGRPAVVDQEVNRSDVIYPALLLDERGTTVPNLLAAALDLNTRFLHTSVPSVLSETNRAMTALRAKGVTSVDMEFAYVADELKTLERAPAISIACLITDFPWSAPPDVLLAEKNDEEKTLAEETFADQLGTAIAIQ